MIIEFTDTLENWSKTVDHCANVLLPERTRRDESGSEITETRYYAVYNSLILMNTVAFYRPQGSRPLG